MTTISDLNAAVRAAKDWINDLMRRLGWQDRERVYLALLATLHALRDCLEHFPFRTAHNQSVRDSWHIPVA